MSRVKNLSRGGWMIVGVVAALILVPTAAVAATATVVKIEASNGNKLAATADGQLLTAEANPKFILPIARRVSDRQLHGNGNPTKRNGAGDHRDPYRHSL